MARKDQLIICPTCGEVNAAENITCRACMGDLKGKGGQSQAQLAQLYRLVKRIDTTNRRLALLIGSIWLIFALYVGWAVLAGLMGVEGPSSLFRWPF